MKVSQLETPALVLDIEAFEENLRVMGEILAGTNLKMRPHYKSNKCIEVVKRQLAAGAKGITCAKLSEAEDLAAAGVGDILIANQIVQPSKIARLAHLAKGSKITVCVDSEKNIKDIAAAAKSAGSTIYCYVEYDVGMNRCGVFSFEEACALARLIEESENLVFAGIQAYAGQVAHSSAKRREEQVEANQKTLAALLDYLNMRGYPAGELSGGSTGTAALKAKAGIYTELQAGSFVFMDTSYGALDLPFQNALFVMSTVISKNAHSVIMDAGLKTLGSDQSPARVMEYPEKEIKMSEEHIAISSEGVEAEAGDMVTVIPGHCCTTVNLYDKMYVRKGEDIIDRWVITSRGKSI